jgi:hypothetical protein
LQQIPATLQQKTSIWHSNSLPKIQHPGYKLAKHEQNKVLILFIRKNSFQINFLAVNFVSNAQPCIVPLRLKCIPQLSTVQATLQQRHFSVNPCPIFHKMQWENIATAAYILYYDNSFKDHMR